ncbi:mannose-6-phosphate isomerase, class I [Anaeromicropila herbilytica]|uniref:mannose-6-phosphate isomerase n=1 Tax=Anaeromicropila herbilytica TaxID=2785025 RepID=A0A7R7ENA6_9FIRM|nr:mannose-6-phosphate isomerase, class I [Anaeromicropila herbilytica]BCN32021.1 mannose-6-phosphate isomerase, class I [Anaeromicropila herbilytica]
MKEILFLDPVMKEMIWGGNRLSKDFHYNIPSDKTGECWAVSAHANGDCVVKSGTYEGRKLSDIWKKEKDLFGNVNGDTFPLLVKIIDAKEDLSIQVHPDDTYAKQNENGSLGKTECWYILDCDEGAQIVIGHNASSKDELKKMIEDKAWNDLIKVQPIKKGDFFQITPGTVHAIKGGTLILETQQNSDITYRLYDYDRLQNGKPRELHLEKSIDVITCPFEEVKPLRETITIENNTIEKLIQCEYYEVSKIDVNGEISLPAKEPFTIMSVIGGEGLIDNVKISKGDHFILSSGYGEYTLEGNLSIISSNMIH